MPFIIEDHALYGTAGAALLAFAYKVFLRLRGDRRADIANAKQHDAYTEVLDELRAEVNRLSVALRDVSLALDDEIAARRRTQDENAKLRGRVTILESEVAALENELKHLRNDTHGGR